jgi:hypothetical protein
MPLSNGGSGAPRQQQPTEWSGGVRRAGPRVVEPHQKQCAAGDAGGSQRMMLGWRCQMHVRPGITTTEARA